MSDDSEKPPEPTGKGPIGSPHRQFSTEGKPAAQKPPQRTVGVRRHRTRLRAGSDNVRVVPQ
ncbi:hypothetical protein MTO96_035387, partial [Rhipicephalus appendiculatus]